MGEVLESRVHVIAVVVPSSFFPVMVVLDIENSFKALQIMYSACAAVNVTPSAA